MQIIEQPQHVKSDFSQAIGGVVVFGADGFVGSGLAEALNARRVVFGARDARSVHVSESSSVLQDAKVIINAAGFRVRPGLNASDYRRSHLDVAQQLASLICKSATLIHISSASVLGKSPALAVGNDSSPKPDQFPCPAYAAAKLETDQYLHRASLERGFRVLLVRPAVIYGAREQGMIGTMIQLARRGVILRLYPREARHHLCSIDLLAHVVQKLICRNDIPSGTPLVVADSDTITNRQLERLLGKYQMGKSMSVPVPVGPFGKLLRHSFHSKVGRFDLATWGEILGVLNLDTRYDVSDTFKLLELEPSRYSTLKTLEPLVAQALGQQADSMEV
jgi:nucleoside-diphosphate-sugar epimerase